MVMIITEFGCVVEEVIGSESVMENVDDDVTINNTSAISSIESEEATEYVEENFDGVFSQVDDETQLSNETELKEVHQKLISMKENVGDALSSEADEAEHKKVPIMYQPKVTFPATFVSYETNIRFGSFSRLDEIKSVQLKLDEKKRCKDAMLDEIHVKWASMIVHKEALNSMNSELMSSRELIKSKRRQIDHVERVINKVKNAIVVEDIDNRVNKAGHIIKNETLSTEDENKFNREIKQLKIMRLQLASNIVTPNEIQQKDQVEEHLKDLNMELKTLKDAVIKAQVTRNTLNKKYDEERDLERELWARFIASEDSCEEDSSTHLYSLEKHLNEEVERYMDECDIDEEIGSYNMVAINSGPVLDEVNSMLEVTDLETQKTVESVEGEQSGDQINENVLEEVDPMTKIDETNGLTKEEIEAMMKEKNGLDEEMKENKAQERKKRNALKAQKRAEKRAQQEAQEEAQQQEKRRLRRLKKREKMRASLEKKRALVAGDATGSNVKDEIVVGSNKSNEFEKQTKPTIKNKNRLTHRGNMIITLVVLVLWVFSFLHSTLQQKPIAGPHRKTYIF